MSSEVRRWNPDGYLEHMRREIPAYDSLQDELVEATRPIDARAILDLGSATGETARRVLAAHPTACLTGIDSSPEMLARARETLDPERVELMLQALDQPLPAGRFELVVSALAVHHLEGAGKAQLFARVRTALAPGGRFVLADHVRPEQVEELITPADKGHDFLPSPVSQQLTWLEGEGFKALTTADEGDNFRSPVSQQLTRLEGEGFKAHVSWQHGDLAVFIADAA